MADDTLHSPAVCENPQTLPESSSGAENTPENEDEHIPVTVFEYDDEEADDDGIYLSNSSRIRSHLEKEGITEQKRYKKKLNLFQWIADIFFHYKAECIVVAGIAVIAAIIALLNMEGKSYDYTFAVYTYEAEVTEDQLSEIAEAFALYGEDIDGDGIVTVDIRHYLPYTGRTIPKYLDGQKLYKDIFGERSNIIILTDERCRDGIIERFSSYHFERLRGEERWVSLESTVFCRMDTADELGAELGLMMFRPGSYAVDKEDVQLRYEQAKAMILRISADYPELFEISA